MNTKSSSKVEPSTSEETISSTKESQDIKTGNKYGTSDGMSCGQKKNLDSEAKQQGENPNKPNLKMKNSCNNNPVKLSYMSSQSGGNEKKYSPQLRVVKTTPLLSGPLISNEEAVMTLQNVSKDLQLQNKTLVGGSRNILEDEQKMKEEDGLNLPKQVMFNADNRERIKNYEEAKKSIMKKPYEQSPTKESRRIQISSQLVSEKFPDHMVLSNDKDDSETTSDEVTINFMLPHVNKIATLSLGVRSLKGIGRDTNKNGYSLHKVLDCALHGTLKEMVTCLKNQSNSTRRIEDIKEALERIKYRVRKLEEGSDMKLSTYSISKPNQYLQGKKEILKCFGLKKTALKIFKLSEEIVRQAMRLNQERVFEKKFKIEVMCLNHFYLSNEVKQKMQEHCLYIKVLGKCFILPQINSLSQDQTVLSFDKNLRAFFQVPYLLNKTKEQKVTISLLMAPKKNELDKDKILLGIWELCLDSLNAHVTSKTIQSHSDEKHFSKKIFPSRFLNEAKMSINVSIIDYDVDYFKQKQCTCLSKLHEVNNMIKKFQEHPEVQEDTGPIIDANITCSVGTKMSLLHAAVILYQTETIDNLLSHGADISTKSSKWGSVLDLAKQLCKEALDRGDERLQKNYKCIIEHLESYMENDMIIEKCFHKAIEHLHKEQTLHNP